MDWSRAADVGTAERLPRGRGPGPVQSRSQEDHRGQHSQGTTPLEGEEGDNVTG